MTSNKECRPLLKIVILMHYNNILDISDFFSESCTHSTIQGSAVPLFKGYIFGITYTLYCLAYCLAYWTFDHYLLVMIRATLIMWPIKMDASMKFSSKYKSLTFCLMSSGLYHVHVPHHMTLWDVITMQDRP